jgi:RNA polymerase sigma-70 factor, ECF subfamily
LSQTDLDLLRQARRGDIGAFHRLVDRYGPYLYGLGVSLLGRPADAEDAVQETLIGAFRGLGSFREESSVKTWLTRIMVRQAARRQRRPGPAGDVGIEAAPEPSAPSGSAGADARMDVRAAIDALAPEHRQVIVLRELHGLSYEEIARALDVPRGTVESRLFRARRALQELLRDYLP